MSYMKRYYELGNMLDKKEVPVITHGKKWYKFAYRFVTGKRLPLFWRFNRVLKSVYHPGNVIDDTVERGMLDENLNEDLLDMLSDIFIDLRDENGMTTDESYKYIHKHLLSVFKDFKEG